MKTENDTEKFYTDHGLPAKPDIIVIITDQERFPAHWNKWEKNLNGWETLKKNGLIFKNAYTSACMCTPSRGVMITSNFSNITGLKMTPGSLSYDDPRVPQMASLLEQNGYDVVWKGKWHLSQPVDIMQWSAWDIQNMKDKYGFSGWNPPDAGTVTGLSTYESWATAGGGNNGFVNPANDQRYLDKSPDEVKAKGFGCSVKEFLLKKAEERKFGTNRKPFVLFYSLVNPHDINFFPLGWQELGYSPEDLKEINLELPENAIDDLKTKPQIQSHIRDILNEHQPLWGMDKITGHDGHNGLQLDPVNNLHNYIKFYAYMTKYADSLVEQFLTQLKDLNLLDDSLIIRTSDHGEMGLSHGLREKVYNVYEETIHIPFVISNPKLFKDKKVTKAMYGHVDFLPTLIDMAGGKGISPQMKGNSLFSVIKGDADSVQDSLLFCYDDESAMISDLEYLSHIRAIRHKNYTYAVYYSPNIPGSFEYELYDLSKDQSQMDNLLHKPCKEISKTWKNLHKILNEKMIEAGQKPFPKISYS